MVSGRRDGVSQLLLGNCRWLGGAILALALVLTDPGPARAASVSLPTPPRIPIGRTISLNLSSNTTLGEAVEGGLITITYDLAKVKATSVSLTGLPSSCSAASSTGQCSGGTNNNLRCSTGTDCPGGTCNITNSVIVAFGCSDPLAGTNTIASIAFQGLAVGTSVLDITQCTLNEGSPVCSATDGSLTVSNCLLDVDGSGKPANVATDVVYIARRLLGFTPKPPGFPAEPSNDFIAGNVDAVQSSLDVDASGGTNVATDIVYIARRLLGFTPKPPGFPSTPSNEFIAANVDALCP